MDNEHHVCDKCGRRKATWILTDVTSGRPSEQHLCEECHAHSSDGTDNLQEVLGRIIAAVVPELQGADVRQCPACGIDYVEFRRQMHLGCPYDYEAFGPALEQLLERIHGSTRHNGKGPPGNGREAAVRSRLKVLQKRQQKAIAEEDYELAAELRDRIGKLEKDGPVADQT